jgi:type IV secretion system protein VirB10
MMIVIGVVVVTFFGVLLYGKHRLDKQQKTMTEVRHTEANASLPATSNRAAVESMQLSSQYKSGLARLGAPQSSATGGSEISPLPASAQNTTPQPQPFSKTPVPPVTTSYVPPSQTTQPFGGVPPERTPEQAEQDKRMSKLQQAIDAPSGISQTQQHVRDQVAPLDDDMTRLNARLQQPLAGTPSNGYSALPGASQPIGPQENGYNVQNGQTEKDKFQRPGETPMDDYLRTTRVAPLTQWVVQKGTSIPATLPVQVVSDLPGDIQALVSRDVLDSPTHKDVMIPEGSRLIGEYNSSITYGQARVQVVWTAIYFPDGSHIAINRMPSHAADGSSGLKDQVDNHLKRLIGGVLVSSLLAAGLQVSQNRTNGSVLQYPTTGQEISSAVGTQVAQLGQQTTSRNLNVQPTLKIRPGEIFAVSVTRDMMFSGPYKSMDLTK